MGDTTTTTTIMFDAWCPFIRQILLLPIVVYFHNIRVDNALGSIYSR